MGDEKKTFKKKDMPIRRLHDTEEDLEQEGRDDFAELYQDSLASRRPVKSSRV